jgi:D-3-phosphoglycerate dehydrogenase
VERVFAANYERDVLWMYDLFRKRLAERGLTLTLSECFSEEDVIGSAAGASVFLAYRVPVTRRILEALPRLRLVIASGSGFDHIDVAAATERRILVCNAASYNVEDVAEHAILLILACGRKLRLLERRVREGVWPMAPREQPRYRFAGQTLGLIGFGKIGRAVAWRARGLGFRVLVSDPNVPATDVAAAGCEPAAEETALAESDYVSLHLRLDDTTRHYLGETRLALMRPTAYLINTSRGAIVDERALESALRARRIAGAGLDVLESEPPDPDHPLLRMDNVLVTGHTAGSTVESNHALVDEWTRVVDGFRSGERPINLVNPHALAR